MLDYASHFEVDLQKCEQLAPVYLFVAEKRLQTLKVGWFEYPHSIAGDDFFIWLLVKSQWWTILCFAAMKKSQSVSGWILLLRFKTGLFWSNTPMFILVQSSFDLGITTHKIPGKPSWVSLTKMVDFHLFPQFQWILISYLLVVEPPLWKIWVSMMKFPMEKSFKWWFPVRHGGTPNSWMIYKHKSISKWMIWGYPYFRKLPSVSSI